MTTETVQRKYALTKVAPGDYLLPSNDGRTIWRIAKYRDGPSHGLEVTWSDRDFWGVWRWDSDSTVVDGFIDTADWNRWEAWGIGMYRTRAEAVKAALNG